MKLNSTRFSSRLPVTFMWISVSVLICITPGFLEARDEAKRRDNVHKEHSNIVDKHGTRILGSSIPKLNGNSNTKTELRFECQADNKDCEKDRLGFDAIRSLHFLIDDDRNGNVDLSESDEFLRDELQYTDGFERQELFHHNDKLISVDDLWKSWKHSAVYNWTVDDMIEWLVQDVDLPQYSQVFYNFAIDGSVLPRLVNSTSPLLTSLGIRNPVHKQKLSLKAMDTILFGAPKRLHSYAKDVALFMAILLAIGISWFACLHHRYSQSQVKKMMKDLEALQKAEDALKKLSIELSDAEKPHSSIPGEKQGELKMFRQNSLHLQVPRMSIGDRSPTRTIKEAVVRHKQEGEFKLKQAEEELSSLRKALSDAENKLEIQQQLDSHWSMPEELQAWMQLTYELEHLNFSAKRQAAERQLLAARDGCEKIKKRKQAFFGSLRMAHSNSLDDIDQSILDARAALEEVKQDLQERLHRWHTIEVLCGFPIISNSGLTSLKQVLGRDSGSGTRMTNSMIAPVSFEEAEEDYQPTDENRGSESLYNQIPEKQRHQIFEWAHRSRHSYWMKKKMLNNEEHKEFDMYNQIPERPRQKIFAWAHRSRHSYWMKKQIATNAEENRGSDSEYNQIPEKPREQIFAWAHRSRDIYWTKKKMLMNDENKESESIYNQIPERPRQQIFAWAHRSRLNHWLKKKTVTNGHTATTIPAQTKSSAFNKIQTPPGSTGSLPHLSKVAAPGVSGGGNGKIENRDGELQGSSVGSSPATATSGSSAGSVVFQLGENFHHQRSHSSASLSPVNSNLTNGNRHGHTQVKSGPNQISHSTTATTSTSSGLRISSSSGNLSPAKTPARISNLSLKLTGSSSGNHISPRANMTTQSKTAFISPASITSEDTDEKHELNHTVDNINNNIISSNTGSISNTSNAVETSSDSANVQSHQQGKLLDDSDVSFISTPGTHFDQSPDSEHDGLEADSLQDSRQRGNEASAEKKNGKKKTLLPKFLQKSKGKQKTL